ncbi:MAG: EVE domain-containing protein [Polyangiaceae bacterium]|nr:EVE domain-containing protein [Polyangiaceae bacterium]
MDDLERAGQGTWEGVRNYQARNFMREMRVGDLILIYHSNAKPSGVVGIARVAREAYPDPFQFDPKSEYYDPKSPKDAPRWSMVDVAFVERFARTVPLAELKATAALEGMEVVRKGSRLSVHPVSAEHFGVVKKLGGKAG